MSHSHSCDDCGKPVECDGGLRQLTDHENSFTCVAYELCQLYDGYRCVKCWKVFLDNEEGPEPDFNGPSLSEACERDAKIGRGR